MYQKSIQRLDPNVNPRLVEGFMRLQYGTLDHLTTNDFKREIELFKIALLRDGEEVWERNAESYGIENEQ